MGPKLTESLFPDQPVGANTHSCMGPTVTPEAKHVLVLYQPLRVARVDGVADVFLVEERGPRDDHAVADAADESDAFLDQFVAGVDASRNNHAGDVDEFAMAAVGPHGDDDVSAAGVETNVKQLVANNSK